MQEIKFRVWDKIGNDWQNNLCLRLDSISKDIPDRYIIMQYTGVKDSIGVDVYEGDKVEIEYQDKEKYYGLQNTIGTVKWGVYSDGEYVDNVECWMVAGIPLSDNGGMYGEPTHTKLVVGNIYELTDQ